MYKRFMTHAKRVVRDLPVERPVLKGVFHRMDGDLIVTDAHRLYLLKDVHEGVESVIDPFTNKKIEGKYPNVARLMPSNDCDFQETIDVREFLLATDLLHLAGGMDKNPSPMSFEGNLLKSVTEDVTAKYELPTELPEGIKFTSNAGYWLDALKMFRAFKYPEIEFNYYGALRPFTLISPDEKLTALILPIRSH